MTNIMPYSKIMLPVIVAVGLFAAELYPEPFWLDRLLELSILIICLFSLRRAKPAARKTETDDSREEANHGQNNLVHTL